MVRLSIKIDDLVVDTTPGNSTQTIEVDSVDTAPSSTTAVSFLTLESGMLLAFIVLALAGMIYAFVKWNDKRDQD